jgi:hypothetical protein
MALGVAVVPLVPVRIHVYVIEGRKVQIEERGVDGEAGSYRRAIVICKHFSHLGHIPCDKKRGLGARQTAAFGPLEPIGFLGCWLKNAADYPDHRGHNAYNPTLGDIRRYMEENHIPMS